MLTSWYWRILNNKISSKNSMNQHTCDNWVKIKKIFEESGNTDNMFYKRACAITKTGKDPMAIFLGDKK